MKKNFLFDIAYVLCVALFSYMATQGSIDMSCHGVAIDSDLQTYAQSLARDKFPEYFSTDPVMHIKDNASVIPNIQTYLASKLSSDEPAIGLLRAGGIALFLFFILWYIFGVWLLESRTLAALLAVLASVTVWVGWGTFWGMLHSDPVPRSFYAMLWPLLLLLGAMACQTPILRPLVMFATGITIWVHGISALCTGAMLASAFAFIRDKRQSLRAHSTIFAVSIVAFLIPVCIYLSSTFFTDKIISSADHQIIQTFFYTRWKKDYSNNLDSILNIISYTNIIIYIFIFGFVLAFKNLRAHNKNIAIVSKMYFCFLAGIFATAVISIIESYIAHKTNRIPLGHELVRGIRFIVPLSIIMIVCSLYNISNKINSIAKFIILATVASIIFFISKDKQILAIQHFIFNKFDIQLANIDYANDIKNNAFFEYEAVKKIESMSKPNEIIFTPDEALQLRYIAFRPIVYTFKEGYIYYYRKDVEGIKRWIKYYNSIQSSEKGYLDAWRQSGAKLLFCDGARNQKLMSDYGEVIWQNKKWIIARLK